MPLKHADKKNMLVSLGDLWQLTIDIPGGGFDEEVFKTEAPVYRFGPWKCCFACSQYKSKMMQCAGTCCGRIFLCSRECQKKSWKEYKRIHLCQKFWLCSVILAGMYCYNLLFGWRERRMHAANIHWQTQAALWLFGNLETHVLK